MADAAKRVLDAVRSVHPLQLPTRIALERILAGLTQSQCARAMAAATGESWSHTLWQKVENGERQLTYRERRLASKILGVTDQRILNAQPRAAPGWRPRGRPRTRTVPTTESVADAVPAGQGAASAA